MFISQLGINCKNAIFQIPNAIRLLTVSNPEFVLRDLDVIGAFKNVSRTQVFKAVQALGDPGLIHYVNLMYTTPTRVLSRVSWAADISSGVIQGDAASSLLFCLAINPRLEEVRSLIPDGFVFAYHDDIKLIGPAQQVHDAYIQLQHKLAEIDLQFNTNKCKLYPFSEAANTDPLSHLFTPIHDGLNVLGTPIGSVQYQPASANEHAAATADKLSGISRIPSLQLQYQLLRYCVCVCLHHLARTLPPSILAPAAKIHTDAINTFMHCLVSVKDAHVPCASVSSSKLQLASTQFSLPIRHSGLGLSNVSDLLHLVFIAAFQESTSALCLRFTSLNSARSFDDVLEVFHVNNNNADSNNVVMSIPRLHYSNNF